MIALVGLGLLGLWAGWRLGGFDLSAMVQVGNAGFEVPDTFARVDHPFHATRAATLLDSLSHGDLLRWIGNHQGGYPAEFYPLGIAWLDVAIWALLLGSVPIVAVHKLGVILIFLLPAVAYWLMARGDRLNPWVAVLATAIHIAIPGEWTNGGYREVIDWGLVTNVGGATLALIACAALARSVRDGQRSMTLVATLSVAAAAYTNPRSLLAVVITAGAILGTSIFLWDSDIPTRAWTTIRRLAAIAACAMLLAGPVLVPLIRYRNLYYFVHFEGYATLREYWDSTVTAVSFPMVVLTIAGVILSFTFQRDVVARSFAVALFGYALVTGGLSVLASPGRVIEQLETPRLMPFQRLVMIYLAAYAFARLVELLLRYFRVGWERALTSGALGVAGIVILFLMLGSVWTPPEVFVTPPIETTRRPEFQEYRTAVKAADGILPSGTAILVIGNQLDRQRWWHQQLWGPTESDAPFFYDDWLWYWHRDHDGPYNYLNGHSYPDPAKVLTDAYFQTHGIGAVVVTNGEVGRGADPRVAAASDPALRLERTVGDWDVYRVTTPTSIVTNGDLQPESLSIDNGKIRARFSNANGVVTIRRNWFPRWEATADGLDLPVTRTDDGYMQVAVPQGTHSLELTYTVTMVDWIARTGVVLGMIATVGMTLGPSRRRLWSRAHSNAKSGITAAT